MKVVLAAVVLCLAICLTYGDDKLECYQCNPVTSECTAAKADTVKCGSKMMSRCSKQIKKGSTDLTKAIRKCVVPGPDGKTPCPDGFQCEVCDKDLCNSASPLQATFLGMVGLLVLRHALQ